MYPQMTRTSSASTVRPVEGAFVASDGPEHPYAMYPQNTVAEEDADEALPATTIPIGFPGMGQNYQSRVSPGGEEAADIIGPDGHLEQLPPYSRYPDDVPRKQDVAAVEIPVPGTSASDSTREVPLSEMTTLSEPIAIRDASHAAPSGGEEAEATKNSGSLKGIWKRNSKRRICCGLPLWASLALIAVVVLAGVIGGVIGTVVGALHNRHHHHGNSTSPGNADLGSS